MLTATAADHGLVSASTSGRVSVFNHIETKGFRYQLRHGVYKWRSHGYRISLIRVNDEAGCLEEADCAKFAKIDSAFKFIRHRFDVSILGEEEMARRFAACLKRYGLYQMANERMVIVNVRGQKAERWLHIYKTHASWGGYYVRSQRTSTVTCNQPIIGRCANLAEAYDVGIQFIERLMKRDKNAAQRRLKAREKSASSLSMRATAAAERAELELGGVMDRIYGNEKTPTRVEPSFASMRKRAISGIVALYGLAAGGADVPETNVEQGVKDLLSDLREYCLRKNIPFDMFE